MIPALGLIPANPGASNELWDVLSRMPTTTRFRLYAEWKATHVESDGVFGIGGGPRAPPLRPAFAAARAVAVSDARKIMRRLSKENVKEFGRALGKVAHANPLAVFNAIVVQIEAYTNMIAPVTDAFKYLTAMGYDALTFVIVEKLAEGREKLKDDGQNVSLWLSALASFCGHLAKKYAGIELSALLQYLVNTLKDNQSLDLLVLKELITRMTGSEALEDVSESQAQAMAGGDVLRSEAINFNNATPPKARAKGIARLRDALQRGAKGGDPLTVPLLVLIAQCRQAIIFKTDSNHLKLVSQLYDSCQETFFHYCDFLQTAFDVDEYAAMLPSLETLVHEYGLEPGAAFHVYRPILRRLKPRPAPAKDDPTKDRDAAVALDVGGKEVSWGELLRVVRGMLPDEVWGAISPELYLTFWSCAIDCTCPPRDTTRRLIDDERRLRFWRDHTKINAAGTGTVPARGRRRRGGGKNASGWRRWWIRSSESATRRSARWRRFRNGWRGRRIGSWRICRVGTRRRRPSRNTACCRVASSRTRTPCTARVSSSGSTRWTRRGSAR